MRLEEKAKMKKVRRPMKKQGLGKMKTAGLQREYE
jgi:hypothetical protein